MINQPKPLKKGDTIAITCPAKKLPKDITPAVRLLESWGLNVILGDTVSASYHQFAGPDELRANDMQRFLDDPGIHAIIAARGGYGTIRIIDKLDFTRFSHNPKWVVGFSDISALHSHIYSNYGIQTIHGQMPMTIPDSTAPGLDTLRKALFGEELSYGYSSDFPNRPGRAEGVLIGGNLTLILYMCGSVSELDFTDKILFIEDVGEYLYSIDRMMRNLKRSGKLAALKGLIIGGFTELKDNDIPFGQTAYEIIQELTGEYDYPVVYDFPAGHIDNNLALILGRKVALTAEHKNVNLNYC